MMREIIFRGKRIDNEEWVEGYYVCLNGVEHRIYNGYAETDCGDFYPDWWNIDPATVGQYTGIKDRNGKSIFEGDIVEHHVQGDILVNRGVVIWDAQNARFAHKLRTMSPDFVFFHHEPWEVIGNIHDNKELIR